MVFLGNGNTGNRSTWWTDVSSGLPTSGEYFQVEVVDIDKNGKLDICSSLHVWSNKGKMSLISYLVAGRDRTFPGYMLIPICPLVLQIFLKMAIGKTT